MLFGAFTDSAFATKFVSIAAALAAVALSPAPLMANSAASAADAFDMSRDDSFDRKASPLGEADGEFRELYGEWGFFVSAKDVPVATVSVPALYPLEMSSVRTSSGFGARNAPIAGASRQHKGIDLAAPIGTPIYATADGIVERSDWGSGYGKVVYIDHGNGIETRYGHMSARSVFEGDKVKKGDVIGYVGSTGRSTGPHLHYEVRLDGVAVNPASFMLEAPGAEPVRVAAK